jgi:hypothetical protein
MRLHAAAAGLYEYYRRGIVQLAIPHSRPGSKEHGTPLWDLLAGSASGEGAGQQQQRWQQQHWQQQQQQMCKLTSTVALYRCCSLLKPLGSCVVQRE